MWVLEGGYITDFTGFRMAVVALHQSPVDFTPQAWLFLSILLGFYDRKSVYHNSGSYSRQAL